VLLNSGWKMEPGVVPALLFTSPGTPVKTISKGVLTKWRGVLPKYPPPLQKCNRRPFTRSISPLIRNSRCKRRKLPCFCRNVRSATRNRRCFTRNIGPATCNCRGLTRNVRCKRCSIGCCRSATVVRRCPVNGRG